MRLGTKLFCCLLTMILMATTGRSADEKIAVGTAMGQAEKGLVLYYPFDEGAGDVIRDKSGNGKNGKIVGPAEFNNAEWVQEKDRKVLRFNGKIYVDVGKKVNAMMG